MIVGWKGSRLSAGTLLAVAVAFAFLLAAPGVTVTASYVNDLFIFLDGAHRIASGQIPNRDFHTALGPLSFYIPAIGLWLSGTMGGAMPSGMAFITLALALPIAHVLSSRLQPVIAIPYGLFLLLILAVPTNFGESVTALSFAMFYNRIGWAALGALLVMYLRPERGRTHQSLLDCLSASALTVVMLYTKITYGLVGLGFVGFLLLDRQQRRWALAALGLTLTCGLVVEVFWQSTLGYFDDLILTGKVSGARSVVDLFRTFLRHMADYTLLGILVFMVLWKTRSLRDLLFFGFCTVPGLLIQNQNAQPWGILTIHAGAAVAAEMLLRREENRSWGARTAPPASAPTLLLMALILPIILQCFLALGFHTTLAFARAGEPFGLAKFQDIRLISPWLSGEKTLMHVYLASIEDGARALEKLPEKPSKVSVLDFSNPYSAGLGLVPPRNDNAWLHWGRNINGAHFIPPEQHFSDVDVLMVPKWGINPIPLRNLYQAYIEATFEPVRESEGWTVYRRRTQEVAATTSP